jgi:hypothetical protein
MRQVGSYECGRKFRRDCGLIAIAFFALATLIFLSGCATPQIKYRTIEVPIVVSCVDEIPKKPERYTPCPESTNDEQCVKRAARDIERLDSALDQSIKILKACK